VFGILIALWISRRQFEHLGQIQQHEND
jgi:hypothetical protein